MSLAMILADERESARCALPPAKIFDSLMEYLKGTSYIPTSIVQPGFAPLRLEHAMHCERDVNIACVSRYVLTGTSCNVEGTKLLVDNKHLAERNTLRERYQIRAIFLIFPKSQN